MSNDQNTIIAESIKEETEKIPFVYDSDRLEYARNWYQAVMESEQKDIMLVKPLLYRITPMTDEQLARAEQNFINSFSE